MKRCPLEHCEWRNAPDRRCLWPGDWCPRRKERLQALWEQALSWKAGGPRAENAGRRGAAVRRREAAQQNVKMNRGKGMEKGMEKGMGKFSAYSRRPPCQTGQEGHGKSVKPPSVWSERNYRI